MNKSCYSSFSKFVYAKLHRKTIANNSVFFGDLGWCYLDFYVWGADGVRNAKISRNLMGSCTKVFTYMQ